MPLQIEWGRFLVFVVILAGIFFAGRLVVAIKDKIKREADRPASQKLILALLAKENRFYTRSEIWEHVQKFYAPYEYDSADLVRDLDLLANEGKIEPQPHLEGLGQITKLRYKLAL